MCQRSDIQRRGQLLLSLLYLLFEIVQVLLMLATPLLLLLQALDTWRKVILCIQYPPALVVPLRLVGVVRTLIVFFFLVLLSLDRPFPDLERLLLLLAFFRPLLFLLSLYLFLACFAVRLAALGGLVVVERYVVGELLGGRFRFDGLPVELDEGADEVFVARGDRSEVVSDDGHVH